MTQVTLDNALVAQLDDSNQTAHILESSGASGDVVVPKFVSHQSKQYTITSIEDCAFVDNTKIKSLSFAADSAVRRIGGSVFMNSSITSLKFPASIEELAVDWCYLARELVNIELQPDNKYFKYVDGTYLVNKNNSGKADALLYVRRDFEGKFVVPSGIKIINNSAFGSCTKLTSIEYESPCVIEKFDMWAFCECSSLTSIQDVPPSLTEVDNGCFMDATSLSEIKFLGENVVLGDNSFYQCYKLKSVSFPNAKHVQIGIEAFHDAPNDFKVSTPAGVEAEYKKPAYEDYSD